MALTWNGKKLDWTNVIYFSVIHAGVLLAPWMFSWTALGIALFLYWLTALRRHHPHLPPPPDPSRVQDPEAAGVPVHPVRNAGQRRRRDHVGGDAPPSTTPSPTAKAAISTRRRTGSGGATSAGSCPTSACRSARDRSAARPGAGRRSRAPHAEPPARLPRTSSWAWPSSPGADGPTSCGASSCAWWSASTRPGS